MKLAAILFLVFLVAAHEGIAQTNTSWNGKGAAVVLTYDDGLDAHLNNALPALDSLQLMATFYIADYLHHLEKETPRWRAAAKKGHELANHTLHHPCLGNLPGREFVKPENDMNNYSVHQMIEEIRNMNMLLHRIDGKTKRTFAFPCGDALIHDTAYFDSLKNDFAAARGVMPGMPLVAEVNLSDVGCYSVSGQSGQELIALVKEAQAKHALLVFLFHGVGGEHSLNVSLDAHSELLHYLRSQQKEVWIAPMIDVAQFVRKNASLRNSKINK